MTIAIYALLFIAFVLCVYADVRRQRTRKVYRKRRDFIREFAPCTYDGRYLGDCAREPLHSGPCNGYPTAQCYVHPNTPIHLPGIRILPKNNSADTDESTPC